MEHRAQLGLFAATLAGEVDELAGIVLQVVEIAAGRHELAAGGEEVAPRCAPRRAAPASALLREPRGPSAAPTVDQRAQVAPVGGIGPQTGRGKQSGEEVDRL